MNIDGVPYRLGDGESLLWDDTYPHEVWNRSDRVRIALLLDVWRKRHAGRHGAVVARDPVRHAGRHPHGRYAGHRLRQPPFGHCRT